MKFKNILILVVITVILNTNQVSAHSGGTDSNSCHTCHTNCEKYGLGYEEYHCHNPKAQPAPSYTPPIPSYSPPKINTTPKISGDSTLNISEDDLDFTIDIEYIINLFNISYSDSEDSASLLDISMSPTTIESNSYGENKIVITVSDTQGAKTKKNITLNDKYTFK